MPERPHARLEVAGGAARARAEEPRGEQTPAARWLDQKGCNAQPYQRAKYFSAQVAER